MEENNWLDYLSTIGAVATPLFVLILTGVGWKYRQSMERKIKMEEKLRDDRIEIYNKILEPFILLLMSDVAWSSDKKNKGKDKNEIATAQVLSLDYRKTSFKLSLIGSDSVVTAFNNLFQHFYTLADSEVDEDSNTKKLLELLGNFLLEIRRSMGNESTAIDNWGMIEWFITDARQYRSKNA
jgi:hypothetical protein